MKYPFQRRFFLNSQLLQLLCIQAVVFFPQLRIQFKKQVRFRTATPAEEKETADTSAVTKSATLDELAGSDGLERINPVMDIVRAGMLKFHVNIHAYDLGDRKSPLEIKDEVGYPVTWKEQICTKPWLSVESGAGKITKETENILVVITGFAENRKKVAAARNELARRMKSAFDRDVEVGWLEGKETEFETEI